MLWVTRPSAWFVPAWPFPGPRRARSSLKTGTATCQRRPSRRPALGLPRLFPATGDWSMRIIVTPWRCLEPYRRRWGWTVQLHSARSRQSWGIGDLADLRQLAQWSNGLGAGILLVNPLGPPAPVLPQGASPYYPTSRRFYNPLYLRVENVPAVRSWARNSPYWPARPTG